MNHYLRQLWLYEMCFLNNKTWKSKLLLYPWSAEWMSYYQAWELESNYQSLSDTLGDQVHCHLVVIFWKGSFLFSWAVGLNSELKLFSKLYCKQMCYHSRFVIPFIELRQSRCSIILKDPRMFGRVNKHNFNLKSLAVFAPNKRVSLSFEALQPGIDFSSPAMKVRDGIFFQ